MNTESTFCRKIINLVPTFSFRDIYDYTTAIKALFNILRMRRSPGTAFDCERGSCDFDFHSGRLNYFMSSL